ncbi:MAG: glycosyltransferase family 4 protein [Planctomycetes bacterium]|nr:glycosyltransferase family 4 protein [Planctomycetota bacterium]
MKIALVCQTFLPCIGGAEFVMHHLGQQWCRQGHDVRIINGRSNEVTQPGATYSVRKFTLLRGSTRFGYHRFPFLGRGIRSVKRLLDEYEPDFTSVHFGYPTGVWLAKMKPVPKYVVTCHGEELTKFGWGYRSRYPIDDILSEALCSSVGAIAISTHARDLMVELGVPPDNIPYIPNGVDLEKFSVEPDFDLRAKFNLPKDAVVILSVGRHHPQKAYDSGLRAFAKVAAKAPEAHYVILGRDTSAQQPLAEQLGIGARVTFCNGLYGDELIGAYKQANIFFSPSIWEMMSLVVLEAIAAGLPEVVTNISGSQDVIQSGDNGFVVEPGDEDAMAEKLLELVGDKDLRERLGASNLAKSKYYGWDHISRKYLELA